MTVTVAQATRMMGKVCGRCQQSKPLDQFNRKATSKDGKQSYCRECNRTKSRRYYRENHDHHLTVIRAYKKRRRQEVKARIDAIKSANGCALCAEDDPVCLEFHHPNPKEKDFDIGCYETRWWRWSVVLAEMKKCVVLCANCHKKVHAGKRSVDGRPLCDTSVDAMWRGRDRGVIGSAPDF